MLNPRCHAASPLSHKTFHKASTDQPLSIGTPTGLDESCTYLHYALEIINFTSCPTWSLSNKYLHKYNFSVSRVREEILRKETYIYLPKICTSDFQNNECMFLILWFLFSTLHLISYHSFLKHSMMESFSSFLLLSIAYDQNWKDPRRKQWEFWENFLAEHLFILRNSKEYAVTCLRKQSNIFC